jgi:hypothetical protein
MQFTYTSMLCCSFGLLLVNMDNLWIVSVFCCLVYSSWVASIRMLRTSADNSFIGHCFHFQKTIHVPCAAVPTLPCAHVAAVVVPAAIAGLMAQPSEWGDAKRDVGAAQVWLCMCCLSLQEVFLQGSCVWHPVGTVLLVRTCVYGWVVIVFWWFRSLSLLGCKLRVQFCQLVHTTAAISYIFAGP